MKSGGGRRIPSGAARKVERDEDLLLFKELHRREKDRAASLLQPVSDEFEPNFGNRALYRITSGKKGTGSELFGENEKHDYDWLKTPPATPLFPSLEMEATAPEMVVQKELPILQPLSRFAGNSIITTSKKSPNPVAPHNNCKVSPRSVTPSQRSPTIPSFQTKNTNPTPTLNRKMTTLSSNNNSSKPAATSTVNQPTNFLTSNLKKTTSQEVNQPNNFLTSNLTKTTSQEKKRNPGSRGTSPSVRSTIPDEIPVGFSNQTPPNLRTTSSRPNSATRGRPAPAPLQQAHTTKTERAKSATRGRRESGEGTNIKAHQAGNGSTHQPTQVFGSRMVDKVMNARKLQGAMEKETKSARPQVSNGAHGSSGTGSSKLMFKTSLDMAYKQLETKRDRTSSLHHGSVHGRSSGRDQYH